MTDEFRTLEEEEVFHEYKMLAGYGFFVEIPEKSLEANHAFLVVDSALRRAFSQPAKVDYDYPFRAADFVRSFCHFSQESKILALAYIAVLAKNNLASLQAEKIRDTLLLRLITGKKPKTPEEVYAQ